MMLALCVHVFQIPSKDSFDTLSALDIAEQLTYLDHQIFIAIRSESVLQPQLSHWAHHSKSVIGGSCHKYHFCCVCCDIRVCRDILLSRQKTCFVATKVCLSQQNIFRDRIVCATDICPDKCFVATKHKFVTTKLLSRKAYFCRNKRHVLSWQTHVCQDKTFVTTKMILVAAPAHDRVSALNHVGLPFTSEEQKRVDSWRHWYFCDVCRPGLWRHWYRQLVVSSTLLNVDC